MAGTARTARTASSSDPLQKWREIIPSDELAVWEVAGRRRRRPFLEGRAAVLVVDVTRDFCGYRGDGLLASVRRFRSSCGPYAWAAIPRIRRLLGAARRSGVPVIYTRPPDSLDFLRGHPWSREGLDARPPRNARERREGNEIPPEVAPKRGDIVLEKTRPSAFFGTPLTTILTDLGVRHVIVAGSTTSGCVRATVLDAHSLGFGVTVVEDCVFDRTPTSHRINLFDMDIKYGNVRPLTEVLPALRGAVGQAQEKGRRDRR